MTEHDEQAALFDYADWRAREELAMVCREMRR